MKFEQFLTDINIARKAILGLAAIVCVLALTVLIQAASFRAETRVTVEVSPLLTEETEIAINSASAHYVEAWGYTVASLMGNVNHENVDAVLEWLQQYFSPTLYRQIQAELEAQAEHIKRDNVDISFNINQIQYNPENSVVSVAGRQETKGPGASTPDIRNRIYEITIRIRGFRVMVTDLNVREGRL